MYVAQENHYGVWGEVLQGLGTTGDWKFLFQGKEYVDAFGLNEYDFHARQYDPFSGRFGVIDPKSQFASGYVGMGNMPTISIDPDGQWIHIVVGAAIGGVFNLGVKAFQGKIHSFKDGAVAFGIGAVAGAVTAATGGAAAGAMGLSSTGVLSGAVTGAVGSAVGDPIRGIGNAAYFGDSYTGRDYATGIVTGGILGGAAGGAAAWIKGTNWWNGAPRGTNLGTFASPKTNNEAIAREGWKKIKISPTKTKWSRAAADDLFFEGAETGDDILRDFGGKRIGESFGGNGSNTGTALAEQVTIHGNSLRSLRPTWGYKLYSNDGTFLKNGITSRLVPETRYTRSFMSNKYMKVEPLFPNRAAAYQWEFQQNQILKGPLNKNLH